MAFKFNYKDLSYDQARNQAHQQVNPLYQNAVAQVNAQKRQNQLNAGQQATARGLSHSGLAADSLNKVAIAAQGQVAELENNKVSKINELAQSLIDRDRNNRNQQYSQNYQLYRDKVADDRYASEFNYQKQRDSVADNRYNSEFSYQKSRDSSDDEWRRYQFNNMSASEKAQLDWAKEQYGEDAAWRMYEMEYQGNLDKSMNDAQIDYYSNANPLDFLP